MTNLFIYYSIYEFIMITLLTLGIIAVLVIYNSYYLKRRTGIYLLLTLLPPVIFSSIFYIFGKTLKVDPSGLNTISITWIPILFVATQNLYYITKLTREKKNIEKLEFNFIVEIRRKTLYTVLLLLLVAVSTFALLPLKFSIPVAIGWLNIAISSIINTTIIIRKI
ncbi:hypothetical protein HYV12_03595 [Candidatus Dojkabacteria bacterium]|nr:hypothetical protein [Candidatus Dojkabacteria bacterium]